MTKNWRKTRNHYHPPSERTGNSLVFISADDNLIARENAKDVIVTSYRTPLKIPGCEIKQCHWHRRSFCTIPSCMAAGLELVFHNKFVVDLGGDTNLILIDIKDMDYEMKIINFLKVNKCIHNKFVVDFGCDTNLFLVNIKDMDYEMKIINFLKVNKFVFPNIYRISVNFQRE